MRISKKKIVIILSIILGLLLILLGGIYVVLHDKPVSLSSEVAEYKSVVDYTEGWVKSGNIDGYQKSMEVSYLAKEADYVMQFPERAKWLRRARELVKVRYEQEDAKNIFNQVILINGEPLQQITSLRETGKVNVTIPDYVSLIEEIPDGKELTGDLTLRTPLLDQILSENFFEWLNGREIPVKEVEWPLKFSQTDGKLRLVNDRLLDKELFGSDDFHRLLDSYATKVGKQWGVEVQADTWLPYTLMGVAFMENYEGVNSVEPVRGDGTKESPAGVGTPVEAVVYGETLEGKKTGNFVTVTLRDVYQGQEAVDYAVTLSDRNRGLTADSVVKLMLVDIVIENNMDSSIKFKSACGVVDGVLNPAVRNGTLYGLEEVYTLEPYGKVVVTDWVASTDLGKKYLIWGTNYKKNEGPVWFRVLAAVDEEEDSR